MIIIDNFLTPFFTEAWHLAESSIFARLMKTCEKVKSDCGACGLIFVLGGLTVCRSVGVLRVVMSVIRVVKSGILCISCAFLRVFLFVCVCVGLRAWLYQPASWVCELVWVSRTRKTASVINTPLCPI